MNNKKLFLVSRPSMANVNGIPTFNYTYAENTQDAINKVRLKFGDYDDKIVAIEFNFNDDVVIGSDYFG